MAVRQTNAAVRPYPGVPRSGSPSGVIQLKAHQPERYTIIGNHLAQHRELSLVAMGLALHILSLPDGAAVDIRTLAVRFPEGRDRIAFALRELEAQGYFERVRERTGAGQVVTRTYAHHVPGSGSTARTSEPVVRGPASEPVAERDVPPPVAPEPEPPVPPAEDPVSVPHLEEATSALTRARNLDKRITLSERDVKRLAPAAAEWITRGVDQVGVMKVLTDRLPPEVHSPAALVAHRLREGLPPQLPSMAETSAAPSASTGPSGPYRMRDCEGPCGRPLRAGQTGICRDCRKAPAEYHDSLVSGPAPGGPTSTRRLRPEAFSSGGGLE